MFLLYGHVPNTKRVAVLAARTATAARQHVKESFEPYGLQWRLMGPDMCWHDGNCTLDLTFTDMEHHWAGILYGRD